MNFFTQGDNTPVPNFRFSCAGAYNVDSVLAVMVRGLEEELRERLAGGRQTVANESPSAQYEIPQGGDLPMRKQGGSVSDLLRTANKAVKFVRGKRNMDK